MNSSLTKLSAASLLSVAATAAIAQPQPFFSIGDVTAPSTPVGTTETVALPNNVFNFGSLAEPGETYTVKWIRFNLTAPVSGDLFLDVESRFFSLLSQAQAPSTLAFYNRQGVLLAANSGVEPILSFGSSGRRGTTGSGRGSGQNGATLPAGRYWLAVIAGGTESVTTAASGWGVTTSAAYPLGLISPDSYFATLSILVGNTAAGAPPSNDTCDNPTTITDALSPAWTGDAINATLDSSSECYPSPAVQALKDVWFRYVATADGVAEVTASNGAVGALRPYLTRFGSSCGGAALQCVGGSSLPASDPVKLSFPVVQGEFVLLSLAVPAEDNSPLSLQINLTPATSTQCLADVAGAGPSNNEPDGIVDGSDFVGFINSFALGDVSVDASADVAGGGPDGLSPDGVIDGTDFVAFINAFALGC